MAQIFDIQYKLNDKNIIAVNYDTFKVSFPDYYFPKEIAKMIAKSSHVNDITSIIQKGSRSWIAYDFFNKKFKDFLKKYNIDKDNFVFFQKQVEPVSFIDEK